MRIAKGLKRLGRFARTAATKVGQVVADHGGKIGTVAGGITGLAVPMIGPKIGATVGGMLGKVGGHVVKRLMEKNN